MIAHVAGVPVEELLVPLLVSGGALVYGIRALITHPSRTLKRTNARERSTS